MILGVGTKLELPPRELMASAEGAYTYRIDISYQKVKSSRRAFLPNNTSLQNRSSFRLHGIKSLPLAENDNSEPGPLHRPRCLSHRQGEG